jgi:hypothetical protein
VAIRARHCDWRMTSVRAQPKLSAGSHRADRSRLPIDASHYSTSPPCVWPGNYRAARGWNEV